MFLYIIIYNDLLRNINILILAKGTNSKAERGPSRWDLFPWGTNQTPSRSHKPSQKKNHKYGW